MTNPIALKLIVTEPTFRKTMNTSCTINMDNEVIKTDDFVTVSYDDSTGETTMHSNADAITLGKAMLLTRTAFEKSLAELSEEDRNDVLAVL